ncbi:MAG: DUF4129 domain-containing protein [Bacteroidia bacterium]
MFSLPRIFFFIISFLLIQQKGQALAIRKDTSSISLHKPAPEKEREIFSDSKFNYKKDLTYSESPTDRFFAWLLRKLFGAATHENANTFWAIIRIALIVALAVLLAFLLFKTEIRKLFSGKPAETSVNFSDVPENINELNIDGLINEALQKRNYRLATRWWYLKLLKHLSRKELIAWKPYKTNFDYYYELSPEILKHEFRTVSSVYEHVWYGDFTIDEKIYSQSVEQFRQFEQTVNNARSNA